MLLSVDNPSHRYITPGVKQKVKKNRKVKR